MLKARILTALCLIAALLGVLFYLPSLLAAIIFAIIAGLAAWEWAGLLGWKRTGRGGMVAGVLAGCLAVWLTFAQLAVPVWTLALVFWCGIAPLFLWRGWPLAALRLTAPLLGSLLIIATWSAMVALQARAPMLLLAAMVLVWIADSAAYFSGRAFGRRKLAPRISPGKTWEGVAGAAVGVLGYAYALRSEWLSVSIGLMVVAAALFLALSIVGDLFESLAKRQAGLKDSGTLLPGHGGVLDRIDSLLPTLPLAALLTERMPK